MQGTRVLDLTRVLAGPWATQALADQGADVIKVEPPEGDETRGFGPAPNGHSTYFQSINRNKRSIVLNLRTPAGQEVLSALIDRADVLVENYRPGVAERLGFGWETVRQRRPDLVYVAIHAFGAEGPDAHRPGYDIVIQAMGGLAAITGQHGAPPTKSAASIADLTAGMLATNAVLLGLLHRERTGEGQKIVINMMHAQVSSLAHHLTRYAVTGEEEHQRGNSHAGLVPYDLYPCADGWLALGVANAANWARLVEALHLPHIDAWNTNVERVAHRAAVDAAVRHALQALTVAEADARLTAAGVPCGPVNGVAAAFEHPAVHQVSWEQPGLGEVRSAGPLYQSRTTVQRHRRPPGLGEHTAEILDELGLDLARLEAGGAFT